MKKQIVLLLIGAALWATDSKALFFAPRTESKFYQIVDEYDLAVVHFNPYESEAAVEVADELERMKEAFFGLSQQSRYRKAQLAFIGVNTARTPELAKEFAIDPAEPATLILFKSGVPFKEKGQTIKRVGLMNRQAMKDLIETYFGSFIDTAVERYDRDQEKRQAQRVIQVQQPATRVVRYVDYDDDYYYYRPGWRRWGYGPRFGVGVGFGGGRGWGGWGRGGGIGFGIGF